MSRWSGWWWGPHHGTLSVSCVLAHPFLGTRLGQFLPPWCWLSGQIYASLGAGDRSVPEPLPRWWDSQRKMHWSLEIGHTLNGSGKAIPSTPSENLERTNNMREVLGPTRVQSHFVITESWADISEDWKDSEREKAGGERGQALWRLFP